MKSVIFASAAASVAGHGSMTHPKPRNAYSSPAQAPSQGSDLSCIGDACYWYQVGCMIGCPTCQADLDKKGCDGNCCTAEEGLMEPTNNDPEFRTWDPHSQDTTPDRHKYNPWRAPGMAPVIDPCGIASGGISGGNDYDAVPTGYSTGDKGTEKLPETDATLWSAGATATVGWAMSAQHSGGYSYRLCPKDSALTEACFQNNVLTFATTNSSIHWNDDSAPDREIITTTYIAPDGSNWRTNPMPQCQWSKGGGGIPGEPTPQCPMGTFFVTSLTEASSGFLYPSNTGKNKFSVMDEVNVPNTPGKYLLSWRWDCEEANQVWNSCADIEIVAGTVPAPAPPSHDADNTCPHFGPGMSCADEGCMTQDESGDCIECCPGCWWMFHKGQNQCRGGNKAEVAV